MLLIQGRPDDVRALRTDHDVVLLEWSQQTLPRYHHARRAALIFATVVLAAACGATPTSNTAGFQTGASSYPNIQNLMLAARVPGIGTGLTTLHRRRKQRIHESLHIPEDGESPAIIPLGWPDRDYRPNRRPPLEQFVMHDRWNG